MILFSRAIALALVLWSGTAAAEESARTDTSSVRWRAEDRFEYDEESKILVLTGNASVRYRDMELTAARIRYNTETGVIWAEGLPDTAGDGVIGAPEFRQGNEEPLHGLRMTYNLRTEKGSVVQGRTSFEQGFYRGEEIRQIGPRTAYVAGGDFTTCERTHPHYDFYSRRMKVIQDDKVIARPVILRLFGVPVFWFPFYILPIRTGRHSGILVPRWGSNDLDGLTFRNIGYYFAPSDHWDATFRTDLRERTGWLFRTDFRYALRYRFRGSAGFDFEYRRRDGETTGRAWNLRFQHTQTLDPTMTLRGSGQFATSKDFYRDNSEDLYERLNRTLRSYFTLDKRWEESGRSVEIRAQHDKNLDSDRETLTLPSFSFRMPRRSLFGGPKEREDRGGSFRESRGPSVYYSLSTGMSNVLRRWPDLPTQNTQRADLRLNLSGQGTRVGWLNTTPSANISAGWIRDVEGEYSHTESYRGSVSANTTVYGLFRPDFGWVKALRHVVKPSVSLTYFREVDEAGGFYGFGGDRTVGKPRRTLSLRLGNLLQMKTERDGEERKYDLFSLDLSTNYAFDAQHQKLSDLSTSFSVNPSRRVDLRLSARHRFYDTAGSLLSFPELRSFRVTSGLRLAGRTQREKPREKLREEPSVQSPGFGNENVSGAGGPWRVDLSHTSSWTKESPSISWIKASVRVYPASAWQVDYSVNCNLTPRDHEDRVTAQDITVRRDLHCWEAWLRWTPSGYRRGYYFRINIKELPQIKFERRGGARRF